jgi:hypothetical protein
MRNPVRTAKQRIVTNYVIGLLIIFCGMGKYTLIV